MTTMADPLTKVAHCTQVHDVWPFGSLVLYLYIKLIFGICIKDVIQIKFVVFDLLLNALLSCTKIQFPDFSLPSFNVIYLIEILYINLR